jgi:hypothetical protein
MEIVNSYEVPTRVTDRETAMVGSVTLQGAHGLGINFGFGRSDIASDRWHCPDWILGQDNSAILTFSQKVQLPFLR